MTVWKGREGQGSPTSRKRSQRVHLGCTNLEADFALEGFDTGVDVAVLLEPRRRGEGLPTFVTGVSPRSLVRRADVPLEVTPVGEDGVAILTSELAGVCGDVSTQPLGGAVGPGTLLASVLVPGVLMLLNEMVVKAETERKII